MESFVVHWGYLALFLLTTLSAFGIPVGSELAMAYGGALASGQVLSSSSTHFSLAVVIIVAVLGELTGSLLGYAFGRFGGRALVDKVGRFVLLTHRDLDRVDGFFARHGEPFVLVGRLIPLLRSFVSIVAGIGEMKLWRFIALSAVGCIAFSSALASLGYALGSSWHQAVKAFSDVGYVAAVLAVIAVGLSIAHRLRTLRAERGRA
jgi:membrane protein DedA with SNARE-associated domain